MISQYPFRGETFGSFSLGSAARLSEFRLCRSPKRELPIARLFRSLTPRTVDTAKCISCMKCVSVCPTGARRISVVMNFLATQGLKKVCATRKENELYL